MINYRGKPVLGPDSSSKNTSEFFALSGTVLFWLLFLIFSFVIKPEPKKQYKEVQIVLSSTPVVQKTEESPAPAEQAAASAASSEPVVEKVVETPAPAPEPVKKTVETPAPKKIETPKPKAQTQPKKEPAKTTTTQKPAAKPAATQKPAEPVNYAKSVEELMAEQFNSKSAEDKMRDFDKMFGDDSNESEQTNQPVRVQGKSSIKDNPDARVNTNNGESIKSTSNNADDKSAKGNHSSDLDKIKNSEGTANGNNNTGGGKNPNPTPGKDKESLTWKDGAGARKQYNLDTKLSEEAKKSMLLTKAISFKISFSVDANGNVISSTIIIANEFMLSDIINKEMRQKISSWKFSTGEGISKAEFIWTLSPSN